MALSTDTHDGWMPGATRVSIPGSNYTLAVGDRRAVCLHIIEGSAGSALSVFKTVQPKGKEKSSHFIVSKAGLIWQCVSVHDSAYANGLSWNEAAHCWVDPQGHYLRAPNPSPAWPGLTPPVNPNFTTISIEREGYYQDIPTAAQNASVVKIMQWCAVQFPTLAPYAFMHSLIGHCHISPVSKANCPGPHVDYSGLAAAANAITITTKSYRVKRIMVSQRQEGGEPYAGELQPGDEVVVDKWYTNGMCHLESGLGFVKLADMEAI